MTKEEKNAQTRKDYARYMLDPVKREKARAARRAWKKNNPEIVLTSSRKHYATHRKQKYAQATIWRSKNKPLVNAGSRRISAITREAALLALGSKCIKCGFSDVRALQIDHIDGGGGKELQTIGSPGVYRKVLTAPQGVYQLLCANCNWIKRYENEETKRVAIPAGSRARPHRCSASSDSLSALLAVAQRLGSLHD
jgi:hypothetical protein